MAAGWRPSDHLFPNGYLRIPGVKITETRCQPEVIVRLEEPADYFETENPTREAFWDTYTPGCQEHLILHQLLQSEDFLPALDLVACTGERIIRNIVYSKAEVRDGSASQTVLSM